MHHHRKHRRSGGSLLRRHKMQHRVKVKSTGRKHYRFSLKAKRELDRALVAKHGVKIGSKLYKAYTRPEKRRRKGSGAMGH